MVGRGRVIFITGFKGGVGKTTVTANIAAALRSLEKRVLIVDGDFGMRSMDMVLGVESRTLFDCYDVLKGSIEPERAIIGEGGLYFLPAPMNYDGEEIPLENFHALFDRLRARFDFVLIDSSADPSSFYMSFARSADDALIVSLHQSTAVRAAEKTAILLSDLGFENLRLVINGYRKKYAESGVLPSIIDIINRSSIPLIGVVPFNDSMSPDQEQGYLTFSGGSNKKLKTYEVAFFNIAKRICGQRVPLFTEVYKPKKKKHYLARQEKKGLLL